jgi:hypothetical protein
MEQPLLTTLNVLGEGFGVNLMQGKYRHRGRYGAQRKISTPHLPLLATGLKARLHIGNHYIYIFSSHCVPNANNP